VTLTNSGTVTLNIMGIAASANYAADSTACGATLAAGANCVISVTFTRFCGHAYWPDGALGEKMPAPLGSES
jgi:hypothetical protein